MQAKQVKQKINSVSGIKRITKTVEMVAASKMKKAVDSALASHVYARYALELLANLSHDQLFRHPLLQKGKGSDILLVVIASEKGLCGAYNTNINKAVYKFKKAHINKSIKAISVGKQAERILRRNKVEVQASFIDLEDPLIEGSLRPIEETIIKEFLTGNYEAVHIAYTEFLKPMEYKAKVFPFLPIAPEIFQDILEEAQSAEKSPKAPTIDSKYTFEPSPEDLLKYVVPDLLSSILLQMILEGRASEHSSRMVAMKNATDNAASLLEDLNLYYNKIRQEAITREISEIVGGSEALSK